jgi:hypothetical protein
VWREPETQGEAYIPLANDDRRPRARAIASETVSLLGGTAYFDRGGLADAARRHPNRHNGDPTPHVNKFAQALNAATKSLEKDKAARDDLISKRNDLRSTVGGNFLSDPFAQTGGVWAAGGGFNPLGVLKSDTANARKFQTMLAQLRKNGVSGQALAAIASTGNSAAAQQLLGLGASGDKQYTSLFNQRASAAASVGSYAGSAVYGAQIAAQTKHLETLTHEVKTLKTQLAHQHKDTKKDRKHNSQQNAHETGHAVAKGVNKAAGGAVRHRRGKVGRT